MLKLSPTHGARLAGVAGIVLAISLFLPWYTVSVSFGGISHSAHASGWHALTNLRWLLLIIGLGSAAAAVGLLSGQVTQRQREVQLGLLGAGILATVAVIYRLASLPVDGALPAGVHVGRTFGAVMALVAGLAIAGGAAAMVGDVREAIGSSTPGSILSSSRR